MKDFNEYITDKRIIYTICRVRAKYAKQRNKKHLLHKLSHHKKFDYQNKDLSDDEKLLNSILPARSKWKKLNKSKRYISDFKKINSLDANIASLIITIDWYRKNDPNAQFLNNLTSFINEIRASFLDSNFKICKPQIHPKLKSSKAKENNVCRPICTFSLKDSIMIGIVNRYFTEIFDEFFYDHALAFKSAKIIDGQNIAPTHHDAIREIAKYKTKIKKDYLWVAESDMNKFFDSASHTVVKKNFRRLLRRALLRDSKLPDERAINFFYKYLDCYNFVKDVLPANSCAEYWKIRNIPDGSYGWVQNDLINLGYFKNIKACKIGIPQGGALSGLIANIVLDYADQKIMKHKDSYLGYFRFCDDMILMHPVRKKCQLYVDIYTKALYKLKLIPHKFEKTKNLKNTSESFWSKNVKSKGPYKWSIDHKKGFPWIGFVGYELHFNGSTRARKSSLKKELQKQKSILTEIILALSQKRSNISNGTIMESAYKRLIGMSIGRGEFWNMSKIESEMCWVKGYSELNDNKHSRKQAKLLDRKRNHLISKLKKKLGEVSNFIRTSDAGKKLSRRYIHYGKPYSYYFHAIEKKKIVE
jgi:hypothetical protein